MSLEEVDEDTDGWGLLLLSLLLLWATLPSRWSRMPLMIVRNKGAGFWEGEYWGRSGAKVIGLVRTLTSTFVCTMVILMLKGAISYARLYQVSGSVSGLANKLLN